MTISLVADLFSFVPRIAQSIDTLGSVVGFRLWCRQRAMGARFRTREDLWRSVVSEKLFATDGAQIFEFGVAFGEVARWWVRQFPTTDFSYVGFDRFKGLPARWRNHEEGAFDAGGKPPNIEDPRISWRVGEVEATCLAVDWSARPGNRLFMFDLDLYEPSLAVWKAIKDSLRPGDILYFDEAFDAHERVLLDSNILDRINYIGLGYSPLACAIEVLESL